MSRIRLTGRHKIVAVVSSALVLFGAAGAFAAAPAFATTAAQQAADKAAKVAGTPCTSAASACVDVLKKQAWLIKDGKILRGPVPIATGGKGEDTPTGDVFRVYRKDKLHKSEEYKIKAGPKKGQPAPMPDAVFFEDGGIAFHSGSPSTASAGCVHLGAADALAFFNFLQIGQHVQVKDGPVAAPNTPVAADNNSGNNNSDDNSDDNSSHDGDSHDGDNHDDGDDSGSHHHDDDDDDDD
jgi:L,D-transpeptidase catalytic domain